MGANHLGTILNAVEKADSCDMTWESARVALNEAAKYISVANETLPVAREEQAFLSAHLATAQFTVAAANKVGTLAVPLTSFRRHHRL